MNHDGTFRRVAIRHEVMPLLERIAGRDLTPVLARQAALLARRLSSSTRSRFAAWPGPEARGCGGIARAAAGSGPARVAQLARRAAPSADELARVLVVAEGRARAVELAGGRAVHRTRGVLVLTR